MLQNQDHRYQMIKEKKTKTLLEMKYNIVNTFYKYIIINILFNKIFRR